MIKNERQFLATKAQLASMEKALTVAKAENTSMDSTLHSAMIEGMKSLSEELTQEISDYENLKKKGPDAIIVNDLEELPAALIKARIAHNLTQKQLAKSLRLSHQQIQKYEKEDYRGVSFNRIVQIAKTLHIKVNATDEWNPTKETKVS